MRVTKSYCDVCGQEVTSDCRNGTAYEDNVRIECPFEVFRYNRAVTPDPKTFLTCRECKNKIDADLKRAYSKYKNEWRSIVNGYGLGEPFMDKG